MDDGNETIYIGMNKLFIPILLVLLLNKFCLWTNSLWSNAQQICIPLPTTGTTATATSATATTTVSTQSTVASSTVASTTISTQSTVASTVASTVSQATATTTATTTSATATTTVSTQSTVASTVSQATATMATASTVVTTTASTTVTTTSPASTITQTTTATTTVSSTATATGPVTSTVASTTVTTTASTTSPASTITQTTTVTTTATTTSTPPSTTATTTVSTTASTTSPASTITQTTTVTTTATSSLSTTVTTTVSTQSTVASTTSTTGGRPPTTTTGQPTSTTVSTQSTIATTTTTPVSTTGTPLFSIEGNLWLDNSNTGILSTAPGDSVKDIKVQLLDSQNNPIKTLPSVNDGKYKFDGLAAGQYSFYKSPSYSIKGYVWRDNANTGILSLLPSDVASNIKLELQDANGKVIKALTATGNYSFDGLNAGKYCIVASDTAGKLFPNPKKGANKFDHGKLCVTVGPNAVSQDCSFNAPPLFSVAGNLWLDNANTGILSTAPVHPKASSSYKFDNLPAGSYCVIARDTAGKLQGNAKKGANSFNNGTYCFKVGPSITNAHCSFYKEPSFSIKGFNWLDNINTGIISIPDKVNNIKMVLQDGQGQVVQSITASGNFSFVGLKAGKYCILASDPSGKLVPNPNKGANKFDSGKICVTLGPDSINNDCSWATPQTFSVAGNLWLDNANTGILSTAPGDSVKDIQVDLTDANKKVIKSIPKASSTYKFDGLAAGDYCVVARDTAGKLQGNAKKGANSFNNGTYCFKVGPSITNAHCSFYNEPSFAIKGFNWLDNINTGIISIPDKVNNIKMDLQDDQGKLLQSITASGNFSFVGLKAGKYCIVASDPSGKLVPNPKKGANKFDSGKICVTLGPDSINNDCSWATPAKPSIKGYIWKDDGNTGILSLAPGDKVSGIKVELQDDAGKVLKTLDNVSGNYTFGDLNPGKYCVVVSDPSGNNAPNPIKGDNKFDNGKMCTTVDTKDIISQDASFASVFSINGFFWRDNSNTGIISLADKVDGIKVVLQDESGQVLKTLDSVSGNYSFTGLRRGKYCMVASDPSGKLDVNPAKGDNKFDNGKLCVTLGPNAIKQDGSFTGGREIRGFLWLDNTNTGIISIPDKVSGIKVELQDSTGQVIRTLTDASGNYTFTVVPKGQFCIVISDPSGKLVPNPIKGANKFDNGKFCSTMANVDITSIDASFATAHKVSGFVWIDNANTGILSLTDPAQSMKVELQNDAGKVLQTLPSVSGNYSFSGVVDGKYCVVITDPSAKMVPNPKKDANKFDGGKYCFTVAGSDITSADSSWVATPPAPTDALKGFLWIDNANTGILSLTDPAQNVKVELQDDAGKVIQTLPTVSGNYTFNKVNAGKYCVVATDPSGNLVNAVKGANKFDKGKYCFTVAAGVDTLNADGSFYKPQSIEGKLWLDNQNTGILSATDVVSGITIELRDNADKVLQTLTGQNGQYKFSNLNSGSYCVVVSDPANKVKPNPKKGDNLFDSGKYCIAIPPSVTNAHASFATV
ncbi:hypothetical protein SAMD00019534_102710 [Acytostelium subglobosum LB1]|uniref:hypothetical protein n=1 Tax=Acytostelium subglobosum LB1 TaxID=1410327 RepID=UPI000644A5FC|nr:hypothetical protein SAMD00019534_102710 [Acytostelium subglobosum LB1]GAM27096.1 hypothetical protein SAMD00019534_102710 [Acytostelium subglobosum LB1]|eukprot:XP_012749976.1 hypothetical protein SAMD00019534_102710 [Acytostelium subglobosum LB1]